jgi:ketosteroid isomerase-like protein
VLTYAPTIEDVQITGDWAIEWGYFDSSYQRSPEDRPVRFRGKLLRALKRLPDGSWRFARVMWNEDKSTAG